MRPKSSKRLPLLVREVSAVGAVALQALVEQGVDARVGVAGGQRVARIQVDVQADRAALVCASPPAPQASQLIVAATPPCSCPSVRAPRFSGLDQREAPHAAPAKGCGSLGRTVASRTCRVYTVGHGTRPGSRLVETVRRAGVEDAGRRAPLPELAASPAVPTRRPSPRRWSGGDRIPARESSSARRRSGEPGEDRYACIRTAAFRRPRSDGVAGVAGRGSLQRWPSRRRASSVPRPCPGAAIAS